MGILSRNPLYTSYIYWCTVNDGKGLILKAHGSDDVIDDVVASLIVF